MLDNGEACFKTSVLMNMPETQALFLASRFRFDDRVKKSEIGASVVFFSCDPKLGGFWRTCPEIRLSTTILFTAQSACSA